MTFVALVVTMHYAITVASLRCIYSGVFADDNYNFQTLAWGLAFAGIASTFIPGIS